MGPFGADTRGCRVRSWARRDWTELGHQGDLGHQEDLRTCLSAMLSVWVPYMSVRAFTSYQQGLIVRPALGYSRLCD